MLYQRIDLETGRGIGAPAPVPRELDGWDDASLADVSAAAPEAAKQLGFAGHGFIPVDPNVRAYEQWDQLLKTMPEFGPGGPVSDGVNSWLGRASALLSRYGNPTDQSSFRISAQNIAGLDNRNHIQTIKEIVNRNLHCAKIEHEENSKSYFIDKGAKYDVFIIIQKLIESSAKSVLFIDPYADAELIDGFVKSIESSIEVRILADRDKMRKNLNIAVTHFRNQFGDSPKLEVRISKKESLHDRLVIIDEKYAWSIGQSFNKIAERSPTHIMQFDPDIAITKIRHYRELWEKSTDIGDRNEPSRI